MDNMKEKTKKKRKLILDAALEVFLSRGYEKTKVIDIAQKAGIGKGTVYEYFDSKEELFLELLQSYCDYYKEHVGAMLEEMSGATCREKLLALLRFEGELKQDVGFHSLNPVQFHMEFSHFPGLKEAMQELLGFKFRVLRTAIEEGIRCGELRKINSTLATVVLIGTSGAVSDLADAGLDCVCPVTGATQEKLLFPAEDLAEFNEEGILDLMFRGFCA